MKKILLTLIFFNFIISGRAVSVSDQNIPDDFRLFGECAEMMMEAMESRDKALIGDAAEGFSSLDFSNIGADDFTLLEGKEGDLLAPGVCFNDIYCTELYKNNFALIEMDDLDSLRETVGISDEGLNILSGGIRSGGKLSLSFVGDGDMNLGIAMTKKEALVCSLETEGKTWPLSSSEKGLVNFASWTMSQEGPFILSVENPTDEDIFFSIVIR